MFILNYLEILILQMAYKVSLWGHFSSHKSLSTNPITNIIYSIPNIWRRLYMVCIFYVVIKVLTSSISASFKVPKCININQVKPTVFALFALWITSHNIWLLCNDKRTALLVRWVMHERPFFNPPPSCSLSNARLLKLFWCVPLWDLSVGLFDFPNFKFSQSPLTQRLFSYKYLL